MAQRRVVQLVDDVDGTEIDDVTTITFALEGTGYEIDLGPANRQRLHDALAPFIAHARPQGRPRLTAVSGGPGGEEDFRAIRDWARQQGLPVSERGRLSREVRDAYAAAHQPAGKPFAG